LALLSILLAAYLEDRPFYVFDEWAADQDITILSDQPSSL